MPVATITITETALLRLMQLSSVSLPVGGYSFSHGLEYAVDQGWVTSQQQTEDWVRLIMEESIARVDLPLLQRLIIATRDNNKDSFGYWNAMVLACRETEELLLTETAMGEALLRLLEQLAIPFPATEERTSFVAAFAAAAAYWQVKEQAAAVGYLWSWLENQVAAATKLVPLGQTMAQQLLVVLGEEFPRIIERSQQVEDSEIGSSLPGLAMASAEHEIQYSRLFRS